MKMGLYVMLQGILNRKKLQHVKLEWLR